MYLAMRGKPLEVFERVISMTNGFNRHNHGTAEERKAVCESGVGQADYGLLERIMESAKATITLP